LIPKFDPHQRSHLEIQHTASKFKEVAAVVFVFAIFAGVLIWGNLLTEPAQQQPANRNRNRRGF
jgi:hypothetical protein